ncbi:MAG TPA: AbrB/MazE/SpoVT family DNA-binding domain-containing protein [Geminicoccus sp.]|uniref:AbrB/MazE/SpoVT family DNA-binding domain-containing protein n=1 Tax=Geminicoccus sp. TaxID=2024832 RepID=UPI002C3726FB|nr:AbrB/MazE/SpoVT family DNA-binding domain-containing protein [Geminicoccus sp.]HWL68503.1 AbrB/MazE/SpoVT family DNA-binding domain-containing protein [Geminicoccus sp.]
MAVRVRIAPNGRVSIPVELRRALGVESGGDVLMEVHDGELRVIPFTEKIRRIQERFREIAGDQLDEISSEDFLAWRKRQWND